MYYLAKFCRICIKTGVDLLSIDTVDFDSVKLREKLEICMKMVINNDTFSSEICLQCIKKLRISYDFHKLCQQSTKLLQGYLQELINDPANNNKINTENFINSELRVTLTPLYANFNKKKRITKLQRCSLLKKLLMRRNGHHHHPHRKIKKKRHLRQGGLKNIIEFTKNYDFGYSFNNNNSGEISHLSKLVNFTNNFFLDNFNEFRDTILYLIDNQHNLFENDDDDDDDMFERTPEEEEIIVEPDIKIKTELDDDSTFSCNYYVETFYDDDIECKKENIEMTDTIFIKQEQYNHHHEENSVQLLDKLVGSLNNRKTFSPHSIRCRTRGNPYINPELKQQFQMRSFQCNWCNRYFKSPGYLKAHISKVHP